MCNLTSYSWYYLKFTRIQCILQYEMTEFSTPLHGITTLHVQHAYWQSNYNSLNDRLEKDICRILYQLRWYPSLTYTAHIFCTWHMPHEAISSKSPLMRTLVRLTVPHSRQGTESEAGAPPGSQAGAPRQAVYIHLFWFAFFTTLVGRSSPSLKHEGLEVFL